MIFLAKQSILKIMGFFFFVVVTFNEGQDHPKWHQTFESCGIYKHTKHTEFGEGWRTNKS